MNDKIIIANTLKIVQNHAPKGPTTAFIASLRCVVLWWVVLTNLSSTLSQMSKARDRTLIAIIGDEDTVTGMLLAGTGETKPETGERNFFVVEPDTSDDDVQDQFQKFTETRKDIAILLINQHIAERIRGSVDAYQQAFPAVLEIPSKDHPYDPEKDSVLKRVRKLFGEQHFYLRI